MSDIVNLNTLGIILKDFKNRIELSASGIKIEVVTSLPEKGIEKTLYLLEKSSPIENNKYDEYLWINDVWEIISSNISSIDEESIKNIISKYEMTDEEVKSLVSEVLSTESFPTSFSVVNTLPEIGTSNILYLVSKSSSTENNNYDEYLWINNAWEIISSNCTIDLSNYYSKEEIDEKIKSLTVDEEQEVVKYIFGDEK